MGYLAERGFQLHDMFHVPVLHEPQLLPPVMDAITEGWALGRRARPLMGVHWEEYWERPLVELREEYGLA